jgi:hypothetical protein
MQNSNFIPKTNLNEYLEDKFYTQIHSKLINDDKKGDLDILEYFNLLEKQIYSILTLKTEETINQLQELGLEDYHLYLLIKHLVKHLKNVEHHEKLKIEFVGIVPYASKAEVYKDFLSGYADKLKAKIEDEGKQSPNSRSDKYIFDGYTKSGVALIFYYFFTHFGIEPRKGIDIAPIAKFIHLVLGKELTKIQNSDFYKLLRKTPDFNKAAGLREDLINIKPLFEDVGLNEVVKLIDEEINRLDKEKKRV